MFLKRLLIQKGQETIRDILFHKGVNLIIDESPENENRQATGNNVGKTTVLRLVDFCFGADGKNIYQDIEFKNQPNSVVENFLKNNNVIITITLVENIDDDGSRQIEIRRNFLKHKNKIQEINGNFIMNNGEFDRMLKKIIFDTDIEKPTFRQIISKNIRAEKNKMLNIVKVLDPHTRIEEYEALYLFWLGLEFPNISEKARLSEEKRAEERFIDRLEKETGNSSLIEQTILFVNSKIEELNNKKNYFKIDFNYKKDIDKLNGVKYQLNKLSSVLGQLETRKDLIVESKDDLEKQYTQLDTTQIKMLYEKAKSLIPSIQVSFEDTVKFHNNLITEKLKYITKELPELQTKITNIHLQIAKELEMEKELTERLQKTVFAEDLDKIVLELNQQYEKKGRLEAQKQNLENSKNKLNAITEDLKKIDGDIVSKDDLIENRIAEFNKFFAMFSDKLYKESYLLSKQKKERGYDLIVTHTEGNPSTGKKKGQISAFDLAYILFADQLNINCLHFTMHDQIENIHDNQLNTLFDVANNINCQYIVPILRDKIPLNIDVSRFTVLSLSQNDKLFKLP